MRSARAFTLLEVVIALAILAVSLVVLVDGQANSVRMTTESSTMLTATMLAQEKMAEVQLMVEREGFGDEDLEDEGDFSDFWEDRDPGGSEEGFDRYHWAWTVRSIEMDMVGDLAGMTDELAQSGYFGEQSDQVDVSGTQGRDLSDAGIQPDMITDMLSGYIRELRVRVWWGDDDDEEDRVELLTHVVNPSGLVIPGAGSAGTTTVGTGTGSASSGQSGGALLPGASGGLR